jgi:hypothetical protein
MLVHRVDVGPMFAPRPFACSLRYGNSGATAGEADSPRMPSIQLESAAGSWITTPRKFAVEQFVNVGLRLNKQNISIRATRHPIVAGD